MIVPFAMAGVCAFTPDIDATFALTVGSPLELLPDNQSKNRRVSDVAPVMLLNTRLIVPFALPVNHWTSPVDQLEPDLVRFAIKVCFLPNQSITLPLPFLPPQFEPLDVRFAMNDKPEPIQSTTDFLPSLFQFAPVFVRFATNVATVPNISPTS